jgi:hypothetical protein
VTLVGAIAPGEATYAVVAILVLLLPGDCVVAEVPLARTQPPVRVQVLKLSPPVAIKSHFDVMSLYIKDADCPYWSVRDDSPGRLMFPAVEKFTPGCPAMNVTF